MKKLTLKKVDSIRNLFGVLSSKNIAKKFKVHHSTIDDIKKGIIWNEKRNAKAKISQNLKMRGENAPCAKLKTHEVKRIKIILKMGKCSQSELANKYEVSPQLISLINTNKIWKHIK